MTIPSIRFDNLVNFKISSENTSPQTTKVIPVSKYVPNVGLAYSPTPTKTPFPTPTPTVTSVPQNRLYGWGDQYYLGVGPTSRVLSPIILGTDEWSNISLGDNFAIGIKKDRTLWGWGDNNNNQLGILSIVDALTPIQISANAWRQTESLQTNNFGITYEGKLFAWGSSTTNGFVNYDIPTQISSLTWKQLTNAGSFSSHMFAILDDGSLWGWGNNSNYQLGDGTQINRQSPTLIDNSNWLSVSCGRDHTVAIKNDGTLWSWGRNDYGQLGVGGTSLRTIPTNVSLLTWKAVSCGEYFTVAIRSDNTIWAWGLNDQGQLGIGGGSNRFTPTQISASQWKYVSAGNTYVLAIDINNSLWSWGTGLLGDGLNSRTTTVPTQISTASWIDINTGITGSVGRQNYIPPSPTPTMTPSLTRTATPTPTPTVTTTATQTLTPSPTVTVTTSMTPTSSRGCLIGETFNDIELDGNTTWSDIAYGNNTYSIIESSNANLYGVSLENMSLGKGLPASGPEFWKSSIYAQDKFVAVGASPFSAYSLDGIIWSSGNNMPNISSTSTYIWNQILYDDDSNRFIAIASSPSTSVQSKLAISDDGISWSSVTLPTSTNTNNTTLTTKNYLCANINNDFIILGSDAVDEHVSGSNNYRGSLLVSTNDGTVWTDRYPEPLDTTDSNNYIGSIVRLVYGNGTYVALAKGKSSGQDCYRLYYSISTIDWELVQTIISSDADLLYGGFTVYGGGKFLLVANTENNDYTTYHSNNGVNWYTPNSTFSVPVKGIRSMLALEENNLIILFNDRVLINVSCLAGFGY